MADFYGDFANTFVGYGTPNPQMSQMMMTTKANPGQPWSWQQYDSIAGMTPAEAMATGKIQKIETDQSRDWDQNTGSANPGFINPYIQYGSVDQFGDQQGRVFGNNGGRLQDLGLQQDTNNLADFAKWAGLSAAAGAGAYALGGVGGATMGGMELATAGATGLTPGMGGAGAAGAAGAGAAGSAAAGAGPLSVGGAGGLPAQAGGLAGLFGGANTGNLLSSLLGGAGALYDSYQGFKDAGEMRDWLVGQTPNFDFYQDKLKQSYDDPGSYWKGEDFNAGFDVLHNKLQRNDAAGGRLAADAGRQSELQKYTLDQLNGYRQNLSGVVNDQTRARLGANEAFANNQQQRRDAVAPITTFLGNLLGG